ncbi:hypothetical protein ACWT_5577 [Actinoplanes sp. SE50]|nr:hypothetical protein ACPL_5707 [Actinoplanes sp. SE50/110]ATO84992.1 hypothetical protein ACWT_5577 [Actinoplanes sp. SE50]SLM02401.1 hypothetical protein ACSP50_5650 [Actinoplanes sp. SE50/110]
MTGVHCLQERALLSTEETPEDVMRYLAPKSATNVFNDFAK